ncbi:MAG: SAM-dependent chlorinase/fluorinase [Candidatus Bathyarchaeota archaeon]|nr:SAM-dependent chlorinase/fluorinase [Candidatus Bathyarchaeota archaeon]
MSPKIITLTTDFGLKDPYIAEMKAAILSICPNANIVDITHQVDKFKVPTGAFILASAAPFFPKDTIHVAVVDPGVGTQRRPIILETPRGFFVGPDNGLLVLAAKAQGIKQARVIAHRRFMLPHVSATFHGRDVFAPAAAHLANGAALEEFGPEITDFAQPSFVQIKRTSEKLLGEVLHVDDFGNIITNIRAADLPDFKGAPIQVTLKSHTLPQTVLSRTYGNAEPEAHVVLIGSHGYLEVALNQGSAAAKFGVKAGDAVAVSRA